MVTLTNQQCRQEKRFEAGCSTLIGRGPLTLSSDWLEHDVTDASSLMPLNGDLGD